MTKSSCNGILCTWYLGRLCKKLQPEKGHVHLCVHDLFIIMKSFKTYDEQIDILSNSGLLPKYTNKSLCPNIKGPAVFHIHNPFKRLISDRDIRMTMFKNSKPYVKDLLQTYGYYNIINQYNKPFLTNNEYINDIDFFKLFSIQQVDTRIKNLIFYPILQIEQRLKTCISYEFAKAYGPFDGDSIDCHYIEPYLNESNYTHNLKTKNNELKHELLIKRLKKIYKDSTYKPFVHYRTKHGHIPIWIFINKLSFGEMLHFYEVLKIQDNISSFFHMTPSQLRTCILFLNQVRNDCAHFSSFINQDYPKLKNKLPLLVNFIQTHSLISQDSITNIFKLLIVFKYLLPSNAFINFTQAIDNDVFSMIYSEYIPVISEYMQNVLMAPTQKSYKEKLDFLLNVQV